MSFTDEFDQHQKENAMGTDFFKFKKDGAYKFRIMSEPVKKVSRYGYGICYEGAQYCQKDQLESDWEKLKEKAKAEGKDPNKVAKPSLQIKWMVWAYEYGSEKYVIFDMSNPITTDIRELMDSDEYGFKTFPMPYDINIKVKNAGTKEAEYNVLPARENTEMSEDQMNEYAKLTDMVLIKERLQAKQKDKIEGTTTANKGPLDPIDYPTDEINPDDIPF